jgi:hypothetical protein
MEQDCTPVKENSQAFNACNTEPYVHVICAASRGIAFPAVSLVCLRPAELKKLCLAAGSFI